MLATSYFVYERRSQSFKLANSDQMSRQKLLQKTVRESKL